MRSEIKPMLALAALAAGCAERPTRAIDGAQDKQERVKMDQRSDSQDGVQGLPSSFGKSFTTLDDYLEHLRNYAGPIDLPWYRENRPGAYELVTSIRPAPPAETYTREQLMRKYGFTR